MKNKHNSRYCSNENSHWTIQPTCIQANVWAGFIAIFIIDEEEEEFFIIDGNKTRKFIIKLIIIIDTIIPHNRNMKSKLLTLCNINKLNYALKVQQLLANTFPQRWMGSR